MMTTLLHHFVDAAADRCPDSIALKYRTGHLTYCELAELQNRVAGALVATGSVRGSRVCILLSKSFEFVATVLGASKAGSIFVPINPILKSHQIGHIVRDSGARTLVLSSDRYQLMIDEIQRSPDIERVVVVGNIDSELLDRRFTITWEEFIAASSFSGISTSDNDTAAIFYTSGSTGSPKGVAFSQRNIVSGAISVATYLNNHENDRLLAVLPFSFDAGFSQLSTAFHVGARVVMLNYLLPNEVIRTLEDEAITGLTAVPPLYAQLCQLGWPSTIGDHLRYFASTGGRMPREVLNRLRAHLPSAEPYIMYGLTEAFRSTYLPPSQVDLKPNSIGIAIPNQEVMVLAADGRPCSPGEHGELVHRGSTVALGYWNDAVRTAERFRPLPYPTSTGTPPEIVVFSGDIVYKDDDGYIYFVGRHDDMIKSSGYRISPTEIEEAAYSSGLVSEAAAIGLDHPVLGQAISLVVVPTRSDPSNEARLITELRSRLPLYMVPSRILFWKEALPRSPNGKIDRKSVLVLLSESSFEAHST